MHIDVYAGYLSAISPQTTSRALKALLTRGAIKSVRVENRYTESYGPHDVKHRWNKYLHGDYDNM